MTLRPPAAPAFSLREARPSDAPALAMLLLTCRLRCFPWRDPDSFSLADYQHETVGERQWVACADDGRLAGFVSVWEPEHFVHHLYVLPDFHRRGIGSALLAAAMATSGMAWQLKCPAINRTGLDFYARLGWEIVGRGEDVGSDYFLLRSPAPTGAGSRKA